MTDFYNVSSNPATGSAGSSSTIRSEFLAIQNGISTKLPPLSGNGSKIVSVKADASGLESLTTTGTGNVVLSNSPTLVTPALGTPSAAVLTNATGLPVSSGIAGLGTNVAAFLATPSSADLAAALTDETGTGAAVFANSPALVTPTGIVKGDVGLGNVDNTSNATERAATATLTNKTIAFGSNSVSGTLAQFNTAVTDADLASIAGSETLTNKTLTSPVINSPTNIVKGDVGLGNVDNTSDVNKPVSTAQAAADTAAANSAKSYADGLVVGLWDDRGSFNASVNTYPTTGGSGTAGAILKGDIWTISVVATSGVLLGYAVGTNVRAVADTPGQTAGNWAVSEVGLGYTPENSANKDATGGYAGLTLFKLNLRNAANTITSWFTTAATVARTWTLPDKDGTVAMTSDIPTGTTPGLTLGTANTAGTSAYHLRADDTILAFDATAPTTQAFGDAAAVGAATVAARRDHKHAMMAAPTSVSGNAGGLSATLVPASGGTGVANNNASTWTISGNYATTHVVPGAYSYTYPGASATLASLAGTETLTNKRVTSRILSATSYTTDTGTSLNCDNLDSFVVTAQAGALKFNNPTGTPTSEQCLSIAICSSTTAARALTWDTQFESSTMTLPTTTAATTARLNIAFMWRADTSKWVCVGVA